MSLIAGEKACTCSTATVSGWPWVIWTGPLPEYLGEPLGPSVVLWIRAVAFRATNCPTRHSRARPRWDVDGDGLLDIVSPAVWSRRSLSEQANALATQTRRFQGRFCRASRRSPIAGMDRTECGTVLTADRFLRSELQALLGEGLRVRQIGVYWHEYRDGRFHSRMLARRPRPGPRRPAAREGRWLCGQRLVERRSLEVASEGWHDSVPFEPRPEHIVTAWVMSTDGHSDLFAAT